MGSKDDPQSDYELFRSGKFESTPKARYICFDVSDENNLMLIMMIDQSQRELEKLDLAFNTVQTAVNIKITR